LKCHPWFAKAVRKIRMLRIEEHNDLLPAIAQQELEFELRASVVSYRVILGCSISHRSGELLRPLTRLGSFKCLFGLDREPEGNFRRAVEDLKEMIAEQAAILAPGATNGIQFNAAVAGIAFGTGYVGSSHPAYMPPTAGRCKPVAPVCMTRPDQTLGYPFVCARSFLFGKAGFHFSGSCPSPARAGHDFQRPEAGIARGRPCIWRLGGCAPTPA